MGQLWQTYPWKETIDNANEYNSEYIEFEQHEKVGIEGCKYLSEVLKDNQLIKRIDLSCLNFFLLSN